MVKWSHDILSGLYGHYLRLYVIICPYSYSGNLSIDGGARYIAPMKRRLAAKNPSTVHCFIEIIEQDMDYITNEHGNNDLKKLYYPMSI